jgi:uncharacterized damage-inducible protein DinB
MVLEQLLLADALRRVLAALPEAHAELRPTPTMESARELAWIFCLGQGGIAAALTDRWQWPPQFPPVPEQWTDVLAAVEATTQQLREALDAAPDDRPFATVPFFAGPRQLGEVRVLDLCWFMLLDAVHHRGQFSVYLRLAGALVPSIYGPSADEPWT